MTEGIKIHDPRIYSKSIYCRVFGGRTKLRHIAQKHHATGILKFWWSSGLIWKTRSNSCFSTSSLLFFTLASISVIFCFVCSSIALTWSSLEPRYCEHKKLNIHYDACFHTQCLSSCKNLSFGNRHVISLVYTNTGSVINFTYSIKWPRLKFKEIFTVPQNSVTHSTRVYSQVCINVSTQLLDEWH